MAVVCIHMAAKTQPAPKVDNFTLVNALTNSPVSLHDFKSEKVVVVIFTSNYCPYAKLYEDRISTLVNQYQGKGVQFLLINSNTSLDHLDDSVEEMARRGKEKNYRIPYLADKEQKVATLFKATKNPEAFVLQNLGTGSFILKYRGAIDDNPQVAQEVTVRYLQDAISSILIPRNLPYAEKRPVGCVIQKE